VIAKRLAVCTALEVFTSSSLFSMSYSSLEVCPSKLSVARMPHATYQIKAVLDSKRLTCTTVKLLSWSSHDC
ncbi:hypothetical protein WAI71_19895, partial [Acinetobacter baumannii]